MALFMIADPAPAQIFSQRYATETCEQTLARLNAHDPAKVAAWVYDRTTALFGLDLGTLVEFRERRPALLRLQLEMSRNTDAHLERLLDAGETIRTEDGIEGWDFSVQREKRPGDPILMSARVLGGRLRWNDREVVAGEFVLDLVTCPPAETAIESVASLVELAQGKIDPEARLLVSKDVEAGAGGRLTIMVDVDATPAERFERTLHLFSEVVAELRDVPKSSRKGGIWGL